MKSIYTAVSLLFTLLLSGPFMLRGSTIVTQIYSKGTELLLNHQSPYRLLEEFGSSDSAAFKYSPLFGLLYTPFTFIDLRTRGFWWGVLSATLFLSCLWDFILKKYPEFTRKHFVIVLLLLGTDLEISLRYQQSNVLMLALLLFALNLQGKHRYLQVALSLAAATLIKLYAVFLIFFAALKKPQIVISYCVFLTLLIGATLPFLGGWSSGTFIWSEWIPFSARPSVSTAHLMGLPILLQAIGVKSAYIISIGAAVCVCLFIFWNVLKRSDFEGLHLWLLWCFGPFLCVFSYQSESPLFVASTLSLILMCSEFLISKKTFPLIILISSWAIFTFCIPMTFTYLKISRGLFFYSKTYGALITLAVALFNFPSTQQNKKYSY